MLVNFQPKSKIMLKNYKAYLKHDSQNGTIQSITHYTYLGISEVANVRDFAYQSKNGHHLQASLFVHVSKHTAVQIEISAAFQTVQ